MRIKVSFLIKFAYNLLERSTGLRNILLVCKHPNFMSTHNVSMSISLVFYKILKESAYKEGPSTGFFWAFIVIIREVPWTALQFMQTSKCSVRGNLYNKWNVSQGCNVQ